MSSLPRQIEIKDKTMQRYLMEPPDMKVRVITTNLIELNMYLPFFRQTTQVSLLYPFLMMISSNFFTMLYQIHGKRKL